jgi:hypothetical protein
VLSLIGYRQTVGAAQERAKAANTALEQMLGRRVVLESYKPTSRDLSVLLDGLARDHNVKVGSLMSITQLVATVYTRIMESDLIAPEQRVVLLGRLTPALVEVQEEVRPNTAITRQQTYQAHVVTRYTVVLAVTAALAATLVSVFSSSFGSLNALPLQNFW